MDNNIIFSEYDKKGKLVYRMYSDGYEEFYIYNIFGSLTKFKRAFNGNVIKVIKFKNKKDGIKFMNSII